MICYNDFGVENPEGINETPLRLPKCKHVFGDHCIKKWFEESDSCPYCRDKVPSEPLRQANIVAYFRNHYGPQAHQQRIAREAANAQLRSAGGPADGPRGGPFRYAPLSPEVADLTLTRIASPLGELLDSMGTYVHRRSEGPLLRTSWQSSPGRRSPSSDLNDGGRRRIRPRHGSMRGSPPSAGRSFTHASPSSGGNQQVCLHRARASSTSGPLTRAAQFLRAFNTAQTQPVVLPSPPDPTRAVDEARFEPGLPTPILGHPHAHHAHAGASSEQARNRNVPETVDVVVSDLNSLPFTQ